MNNQMETTNERKTFCWNCWRDWHEEFLSLAAWEQEQFLMVNPRINPNDFDRGRCPFCGAQYNSDDSKWFEDIFSDAFEFDDDIDNPQTRYGLADWEQKDDENKP